MEMNKEPINPGEKPTIKPSLFSIISKKLRLRPPKNLSYEQDNKGSSILSGQENAKTKDITTKKTEKKKVDNKNKIKTVLKKLKKTTACLPKALQTPYAYEKGEKCCQNCNMDKETYRSVIKSVKVIELIVDDVINKEQKEMLDKEDEQDINEPNETVGPIGEKKISIQFEVYCQKDIDHNLKCVIVKLQRTIGDVLLKLCYCKLKENSDDEKCKEYDISVNDINQLKFEYTNLTHSIIRMFNKAPLKQKTSPDTCVACLKEEIVDCTEILEGMLENGRYLKVNLTKDDAGKDKCCSRNYPHVHVLVQEDTHLVLKYELPFEAAQSQGGDEPRELLKEKSNPKEEPEDYLTGKEKPEDSVEYEKPEHSVEYEEPECSVECEEPEYSIEYEKPEDSVEYEEPKVSVEYEKPEETPSMKKEKVSNQSKYPFTFGTF